MQCDEMETVKKAAQSTAFVQELCRWITNSISHEYIGKTSPLYSWRKTMKSRDTSSYSFTLQKTGLQ